MVHGVSQQVDEGISNLFNYCPIEFGFLSFNYETYFFICFLRYISHQARKTVENRTDGKHPGFDEPPGDWLHPA